MSEEAGGEMELGPPSGPSRALSLAYRFLERGLSDLLENMNDRAATLGDDLKDMLISLLLRLAQSLFSLISPILKMMFFLLFSFLLANLVYLILYKLFFPVDLIEETLHVNYRPLLSSLPTATLKLSASQNQWQYLNGGGDSGSGRDSARGGGGSPCERFFHAEAEYRLTLKVYLSKSERNRSVGKCMVDLRLIDCAGDVLGHSARVVRVPFSSASLSWIKFLMQLPGLVSGLVPEHDVVEVEMMNNYRERSRHAVPTEVVEVVFSAEAHELDIEKVSLTILPLPTGIA
jgi:hypothetical protein